MKNESKSMIFLRAGPDRVHVEGSKCNVSVILLDFFCIGDVLGGLVDVGWTITGPWKQWGLAKHIAKPSK